MHRCLSKIGSHIQVNGFYLFSSSPMDLNVDANGLYLNRFCIELLLAV